MSDALVYVHLMMDMDVAKAVAQLARGARDNLSATYLELLLTGLHIRGYAPQGEQSLTVEVNADIRDSAKQTCRVDLQLSLGLAKSLDELAQKKGEETSSLINRLLRRGLELEPRVCTTLEIGGRTAAFLAEEAWNCDFSPVELLRQMLSEKMAKRLVP